jgi:hypothetical protein
MRDLNFILAYAQSCAGGKLPLSDCGPAWQLLVIAVLLVLAVSTLAVLRLRSGMQASAG